MVDQVPWGAYIANFTYLVGMAAAAVMLVIPAYVYHDHALHEVVVLGELLAVAVLTMCLMFVMVDIGRPDRFWHLIPVIGRFNWPISMLSWDVIVLNGYLALNFDITTYLLFTKFRGKTPDRRKYVPFVLPRDRLGLQHPHGHGLPLQRHGGAPALERGDPRAALPRVGVRGGARRS